MENYKLGIIGAGTVGSETARRLLDPTQNAALSRKAGVNLQVAGIFTRNPGGAKSADIHNSSPGSFVQRPEDLIDDPSVKLIVETMGGTDEASEFIRRALKSGKNVVTANKDLLSKEGEQLFGLADEYGVVLGIEASVAGGIPIIKAITQGTIGDEIYRLMGIQNGTSNYMLTQMRDRGMTYADALAEAQRLGYAESDPKNDVEGYDAAYKLSVETPLIFGQYVPIQRFHTIQGINEIDAIDFQYFRRFGSKVKLLTIAEMTKRGTITLLVAPHVLKADHQIARVDGSLNCIELSGLAEGKPTFYSGPGAGDKPTANSILSDVINIARGSGKIWVPKNNEIPLTSAEEIKSPYYIRISTSGDRPGILGKVATCLGTYGVNIEETAQEKGSDGTGLGVPFVLTTGIVDDATMAKIKQEIKAIPHIASVLTLRMVP